VKCSIRGYHILHRKMMFLLEGMEGKPNPRFFVVSLLIKIKCTAEKRR